MYTHKNINDTIIHDQKKSKKQPKCSSAHDTHNVLHVHSRVTHQNKRNEKWYLPDPE